jgi:hypothetical protein
MSIFGSRRSSSHASFSDARSSMSSAPPRAPTSPGARPAPLAGRRFEATLLLAALPAAGREHAIQRVLEVAPKRPPWSVGDVGSSTTEQLQGWQPLAQEKLAQHQPRGLLLILQTEVEAGLRSMATPFWLLNRVVRGVILARQGRRIGQVYRELERQLGNESQALAAVALVIVAL